MQTLKAGARLLGQGAPGFWVPRVCPKKGSTGLQVDSLLYEAGPDLRREPPLQELRAGQVESPVSVGGISQKSHSFEAEAEPVTRGFCGQV